MSTARARPPRDTTRSAGGLLLFDLDGTLVDSAPDIAASVDAALAAHGLPQRGLECVRAYIGDGAEQLLHRAVTGDFHGTAEPQLFRAVYHTFQQHYAHGLCRQTRPYPGVVETLAALAARGWNLGCVTNKPARFTTTLLRALELGRFFSVVVAGDTLPEKKPDPRPLLHAARVCGAPLECCVMVGDSVTDIRAARAAGIRVISVSYGYESTARLVARRPDALLDSMPAILDYLESAAPRFWTAAPAARDGGALSGQQAG